MIKPGRVAPQRQNSPGGGAWRVPVFAASSFLFSSPLQVGDCNGCPYEARVENGAVQGQPATSSELGRLNRALRDL